MPIQFTEKWDQYGLMAELALKLEGVSPQFGKTVLQKLVYILQEIYRVPCGYDYILYNYGPYSEALADDLSFFASMDGVKVEWNRRLGYEIKKAERTSHFRERGKDFLTQHASQIDEVIKEFGSMNAKELELRSTILYVSKEEPLDKSDLLDRVKDIKPHFTVGEIDNAYQELERWL
ncbi:YwgA family protein [Syntrophomonas wolfei]|uniref:Uncharacterized protein n=1 Tax=Syntrophomonas wolfei subsp. wolfei (strain DSM 2245B / Goettingen) TaxID=335541 RepID=Q0B0J3_SYNWW|nr:type II toxin-antitoxin system antitoxin SocA domain-containing protein [Syntrophomonas wolfei]ABI67511.1 hypothetical protein Swol_0159 [Syntrophomonas wolfei subsp. wolfei str. Goettingen G311]